MAEFMHFEWNIPPTSSSITTNNSNGSAKLIRHDLTCEDNSRLEKRTKLENLEKLVNNSTIKISELQPKCTDPQKFLQKFLYARKYDVDEAYRLLQNYNWHRRKYWPQIFQNLSVNSVDIRKCFENGVPAVLSQKDRKGRCVLLLNANRWDQNVFDLLAIYRAFVLTLDFLTEDVHNQSCGVVIIVDWTEFTLRQCAHLKPAILRVFIEGLQDSYPVKFKGIHFIGQPWYVVGALACLKPFLTDKIKQRIFLHGNNLSTLHEYVHRDILPTELGGEQPSYNPELWMKTICNKFG